MSVQSHRSDPRILGRRTLEHDHRHLATLLRPGLSVLDVGCGTGAITAGIARAVGPDGSVAGIDRNQELLAVAMSAHSEIANLRFETGDATDLPYSRQFDIVTAARVLQWIENPASAIERMKRAIKRGGLLVVLDYNHAQNAWEPQPPPEFMRFYQAFLDWRQANQWDNEMADHLPELFREAGLQNVESFVQDEIAENSSLWTEVIDSVGSLMQVAGFCTPTGLQQARDAYVPWVETELRKQTLAMRTVTGVSALPSG